jgi:DNA repair exonuclease SbcCD ATPase subunit
MNLYSIEMEGYSSYKDYTYVPIPAGITGIIGSIDGSLNRSNGSGKSSLVMAILYALFGEGEANTIDEYINDESEEMFVRLKYELNGVDYTVERGIRKKASYLDCYMNNDPENRLGDNIKTTQAAIIETFGMDYNMLTASNFFEQSGMDKFINTDPTTRRNYIDKVLQLEVWRKVLKEITSDIKKSDDLILDLQNKIESFKQAIEALELVLKDKNKLQNDIIIITNEKNNIQIKINAYSTFKTLTDSLKSNKSFLESENTRFLKNEKSILSLTAENSELNNDINALVKEDKRSSGWKEEYKKLSDDVNFRIDHIVSEIDKSTSERHLIMKKMFEIEANLSSKKSQLNKIISGVCPTCKQQVNVDLLEKENNELNEIIKNITEEDIKIKKVVDEKTENMKFLEQALSESKKQLNQIIEKINEKTTKEAQTKSLVEVKNTKIQSNEKQLKSLEEDQKLNKEKISDLEKIISDLEGKTKDIDELEKEYNANIILINDYNKKLDKINFDLGILNEKEAQKGGIETELLKCEDLLKETRETRQYDETLRIIFSDIPRQIFNSSIKLIEEFSNDIIHQIFPEVSVTIYEDTSKKAMPVVIGFEVNSKYRSYKRLSGGQRTIANIGIRLGFSRVIAMKSKSNVKFIVMDEPFGSLDEENRSLIKKILTLISNYFNQILIITHTEDSDSFPNIINVRMSPEYRSYIVNQ